MTNNKIFTAILALAFIFTAEKAAAECDGFYLAGRAGYAEYEVDDDRSGVGNSFSHYVVDKKRFIASGGIGYRHEHFRTEIVYVEKSQQRKYLKLCKRKIQITIIHVHCLL